MGLDRGARREEHEGIVSYPVARSRRTSGGSLRYSSVSYGLIAAHVGRSTTVWYGMVLYVGRSTKVRDHTWVYYTMLWYSILYTIPSGCYLEAHVGRSIKVR